MITKMKRFLSTALVLVLALSCIPRIAFAGDAADSLEVALPTATVTEIENEELTFALNFRTNEATEEQLNYYGEWYADFVLTVNQDVTFNAAGIGNDNVDGYLAGQYDAFGPGWVKVPLEDVTLNANEPLKIMEYAADILGEPGLQFKYADIYETVRDFDCGVYFKPEFLEANPNFKVTLELRMYNPENEMESYAIGDTYTFRAVSLPTATVTRYNKEDLTFALNFKADEVTTEQLDFYSKWYADFVLTVNKDVTFNADETETRDGFLSGQYDEWSENWVNVPFEDVELKANEPLKIMEYAAELMGELGLKYTYGEVYEFVKDFDCGVFFEEDFLAENPDLEVTLELRMYNWEDESESYAIGDTYYFRTVELPTATVTKIDNEELTFALNFLADDATEQQLALYGDWYADFVLTVNKDVTFNANGSADGYLSGQYDAVGSSWVDVPPVDVTLEANRPLQIMSYAAYLLGEPGLRFRYSDIYSIVKDFDCGVFFKDEFLAKNPELKVTLELRMYNPDNEKESYAIGDTYHFRPVSLPTATVKEIENENLTFALNFKADEVTTEQLNFYKNWYADFELTVNKDVTFNANETETRDGFLSGQYDEWSENWVNVPIEDVTLEANKPLKIMAYAAEFMGEPGLKYTYGEVYEAVKDFDCGVFFEPEFLVANPDLEVTLELRMYNPDDETETYVIGREYKYNLEDAVAINMETGKIYEEVQEGLIKAETGQTVALLKDVETNYVMVPENVVLDLDEYTLKVNYFSCFGDTVDNSDSNEGLLVVPEEHILMQKNNAQLPVKNGEGYQFFEVTIPNMAFDKDGKFAFQPFIEANAHELLKKGTEVTGVTINVRLTWGDGNRFQEFVYVDEMVNQYLDSYGAKKPGQYGQMFTLLVNNDENYKNLTYEVVVKSAVTVEIAEVHIYN